MNRTLRQSLADWLCSAGVALLVLGLMLLPVQVVAGYGCLSLLPCSDPDGTWCSNGCTTQPCSVTPPSNNVRCDAHTNCLGCRCFKIAVDSPCLCQIP